jgi:hypothetical protein
MDAPQYVHSHYFCLWMFYYTNQINADAPQNVQVDAPSDYLCPWKFYYTIHINTYAS